MMGEQYVFMLVLAVFFWGISKKSGLIMASTLLVSLLINNVLKIIFHSPRPFEVLNHLTGKRMETATGYSFPSGHTQGASSFYTTLFYLYKRPLFRIFCGLIIIMVGISRVYLGVHWPQDVLAGWGLGILTAWITATAINRFWDNPPGLRKFLLISILSALILTLGMTAVVFLLFQGAVKGDDFFKSSGILIGAFSGFLLEKKISDFDAEKGKLSIKILRIILGLGGALMLQEGLKVLFPDHFLFHTIRYLILGLWITFLFPLIGCRTGLFHSKKSIEL